MTSSSCSSVCFFSSVAQYCGTSVQLDCTGQLGLILIRVVLTVADTEVISLKFDISVNGI